MGSLNEDHHLEIVKAHGGSIYNTFLYNMRMCGVLEFVNPLKMTSEEASKLFDNQSLDFVFLDANHSYEEVLKDIGFWRAKIKKGGCLAGRDFDWPGVGKAVKENIKDLRLLPPNVWYEFL